MNTMLRCSLPYRSWTISSSTASNSWLTASIFSAAFSTAFSASFLDAALVAAAGLEAFGAASTFFAGAAAGSVGFSLSANQAYY